MTIPEIIALTAKGYKPADIKEISALAETGEDIIGLAKACDGMDSLRELLELVKDHPTITLDVEMKEYPTAGKEQLSYDVCDKILQMVDEYNFADRVVINTFSGKLHEYIEDKYGAKYRRHVYYPMNNLGAIKRNPYKTAFCCCMFATVPSPFNMAEKMEFDRMASYGIEPWAGAGVRDEAGVDEAIKCGATLITCNNPDVILDLLRKKGYHK